MTALYVAEVLVVVAAVVGMFRLRRVGDLHWRRHLCRRTDLDGQLSKDLIRFQIVIHFRLTPAFRDMARAISAATPAMERMAEALRPPRSP